MAVLLAELQSSPRMLLPCPPPRVRADYNSRPTDYNSSQPGLGSVFRAARAYFLYSNNA